jgi:uncharacterized FlaG/YvyC family protein
MEIEGIREKFQTDIPQIRQEPAPKAKTHSDSAVSHEMLEQEIRRCIKGNEETVAALTEKLNQFIETMQYSLQFIPEKDGKQIIIKVYDGQGKLIRRIPPESMSMLADHLGESIGLMLNRILE